MKSILIWILFYIVFCIHNAQLELEPPFHKDDAVGECVNRLIHRIQDVIRPIRSVLYINEAVANFSSKSCNCDLTGFPFTMNVGNVEIDRADQSDMYIITAWNLKYLSFMFAQFRHGYHYDSSTPTIIVLKDPLDIQMVFKMLWDVYLLSALVIDIDMNLWVYYPMTEGKCNLTIPKIIYNCNEVSISRPLNLQLFFAERNLKIFPGCHFKITTAQIDPFVSADSSEGFEIEIMKSILKQSKITFEINKASYSEFGVMPNGTYSSMMKSLVDGEANMVLGSTPMKKPLVTEFTYLQPHCITEIRFFVPLAEPATVWKNMFFIFQKEVWFLIILSYLTVSIFSWWFSKKSLQHQLLMNYTLMLTCSKYQPRDYKLRFLFILWTICVLVLSTGFQSRLISLMMKSVYDKQITTLAELAKSDLAFGGFDRNHFVDDPEIYNNWQNCTLQGSKCFDRMFEGKFGFFKNKRSVLYRVILGRKKKLKRRALFIFKECVTMYLTMYLQKGSPFKTRFDNIIGWLFSNGLIDKWDEYKTLKKDRSSFEHDAESLSIKHLLPALLILCLGLVSALGTFLIELMSITKTGTKQNCTKSRK